MASNSILKLQVDDKQYEASLKSAQQGLKALQDALRNSGKSFADVDKQTEGYVRALGKMGTTAKTARGGIGEMSSAFVELSRIEKQLTDQERQSPVGKALTESLGQLKQRTIDAKNELQGLENQIKNVGEVKKPDMGGLFGGDKLSGMLQVAGGKLLAQGITTLGSELASTIQQGIELARQGEGIRMAFDRLNKPGLLDNLKEATHGTVSELELMKAAVKFDDFKLPVEQLGTLLAFAQKKAKDTGQSVDYMVDSIVTGLGRKSLMILDNLGLSAAQIKDKMKESGDMTKAVASIIKEQMAASGDYVETAADRAARAAADATNEMERLGREAQPFAEEWAKVWNELKIGGMSVLTTVLSPIADSIRDIREILSGEFVLKIRADIPNLADGPIKTPSTKKPTWGDVPTYTAPGGYVEITDTNTGSVIGGQHFDNLKDTNAINAWKKSLNKTTKSGKSSKQETTELQQNQKKINDLVQEYIKLGDQSTESAQKRQEEIQKEIQLLQQRNGLLGLRAEQAQGRLLLNAGDMDKKGLGNLIANPFADDSKKTGGLKLTLDDKAMKSVTRGIEKSLPKVLTKEQKIEGMQNLLGGVNGVLGGIQQIGIEIPEEIQSVMGVLNGIMAIVTSIESIVFTGQFLNLFANGGVVHAANGYVSGNSFSGDMVPAMLNSGELVLNRFQQQALAANIQNKGGGNMQVVGKIRGEEIVLVANRYFKRTGQGEILTW